MRLLPLILLAGCNGVLGIPTVTQGPLADGGAGAVDSPVSPDGMPGAPDARRGIDAKVVDAMPFDGCAASTFTATKLPLDLFIMLDQSASMSDSVTGGTKWSAVTSAIESFVQQNLPGVSAGLGYFGVPPSGANQCTVQSCTMDSDCGSGCGPCNFNTCNGFVAPSDSCVASDYATPSVEIAPLPGVSSAFQSSIAMHQPTTATPTSAALQGAIQHAQAWAQGHFGHTVAVVLATDGLPSECDTMNADIDAIAAAGVNGNPKILTFVVGVGTTDPTGTSTMNGIAASGGTTSAFFVDTGQDVNAQFTTALEKIQGSKALGCNYQIPTPSSGTLDYSQVGVQWTPGGSSATTLTHVGDQSACPSNENGWYYDNPTTPNEIILCGGICDTVQTDTSGGRVDVVLGCQ